MRLPCVDALTTSRMHHVVEFGLAALASHENVVLAAPKAHAHGLERPKKGEHNGRTAIAAFELWREEGSLKRRISEEP